MYTGIMYTVEFVGFLLSVAFIHMFTETGENVRMAE